MTHACLCVYLVCARMRQSVRQCKTTSSLALAALELHILAAATEFSPDPPAPFPGIVLHALWSVCGVGRVHVWLRIILIGPLLLADGKKAAKDSPGSADAGYGIVPPPRSHFARLFTLCPLPMCSFNLCSLPSPPTPSSFSDDEVVIESTEEEEDDAPRTRRASAGVCVHVRVYACTCVSFVACRA